MTTPIDINFITEKYRVLGLPLHASKEQLRQQRNKMLMKFHPDRHPTGWIQDDVPLEQRVHIIQSAFRFIMEHYEEIQDCLAQISTQCLTQRCSKQNRSHWIYSEIESYDKNHNELALTRERKE